MTSPSTFTKSTEPPFCMSKNPPLIATMASCATAIREVLSSCTESAAIWIFLRYFRRLISTKLMSCWLPNRLSKCPCFQTTPLSMTVAFQSLVTTAIESDDCPNTGWLSHKKTINAKERFLFMQSKVVKTHRHANAQCVGDYTGITAKET